MVAMQKIEAAIGEADAQTMPTPFLQALIEHRPVGTILSCDASEAAGRMRWRISPIETVDVPRLPTTTAAAALAARMAYS
jgi:hypothetical protein